MQKRKKIDQIVCPLAYMKVFVQAQVDSRTHWLKRSAAEPKDVGSISGRGGRFWDVRENSKVWRFRCTFKIPRW